MRNWRLGNDSRVKDGFWPEFQSAMLGRKDAKTALGDERRRLASCAGREYLCWERGYPAPHLCRPHSMSATERRAPQP